HQTDSVRGARHRCDDVFAGRPRGRRPGICDLFAGGYRLEERLRRLRADRLLDAHAGRCRLRSGSCAESGACGAPAARGSSAEAARNYLVSRGCDGSKIETYGYGKTMPVKSCPNQKNRKAVIECLTPNRRVEIEVQATRR